MSAWTCQRCGEQYWNDHDCPMDPEQIPDLKERVRVLEDKLAEVIEALKKYDRRFRDDL